jgi:hypothetical protein
MHDPIMVASCTGQQLLYSCTAARFPLQFSLSSVGRQPQGEPRPARTSLNSKHHNAGLKVNFLKPRQVDLLVANEALSVATSWHIP